MKKPRSYILANSTKVNDIKPNHFGSATQKNENWYYYFLPNVLQDCGAGCQSTDTNSPKRRDVPFLACPQVTEARFAQEKKKKKSKFKCSLYKSTRVASPVPVAIAISNWNVVIVNTTFSDWIASFISHQKASLKYLIPLETTRAILKLPLTFFWIHHKTIGTLFQ